MSLRLSFHGAAQTVTGSCFRLETERGQVLIDCGLFQGSKTEKDISVNADARGCLPSIAASSVVRRSVSKVFRIYEYVS